MQVDDAVGEILEDDVAAVLRDRRADAGFEQLLDLRDDLVVFLFGAGRGIALGAARRSPGARR